MRPPARILGVAAAWALLGSGCDYWRNLTEPPKADKVDLVLMVKDAWTGEALPWATCSVEGAGSATADAEGTMSFSALPTGAKSVDCSSDDYHDRKQILEAGPGRGRFEVALARKGGAHWYPGRPELQVRIQQNAGNLRVPGKFWLQGFPYDSALVFRYSWTSSRPGSLPSINPLPVETPMLDQDTMALEVTLAVTATLAGITYEVGTYEETYLLARNLPPSLAVTYNAGGPQRVGTGCEEVNTSFIYSASDPDGDSCTVRFISKKLDSPLGDLDTVFACGDSLPATFTLASHDGLPDWSRPRSGELRILVEDENGGMRETTLVVATYSNLHPLVNLDQVDAGEQNLAGDSLRFQLLARDRDAIMKTLTVDWNDGTKPLEYSPTHLSRRDSMDVILAHSFEKAGTYDVVATTSDGCKVTVKDTLRVLVVDRPLPWKAP